MNRNPIIAGIFGALAIAGASLMASNHAHASETLPAATAQQLDQQPAEFTQSAASQRRHMIIRETMRQQRYGNRGYGHRRYGYGPRYGHGPRPGYYRHHYRRW